MLERTLVVLKNFRCFAKPSRTTIEVGPSLTSIVGLNNSGKSALLRFFYECRPVLRLLSTAFDFAQLDQRSFEVHMGESAEYFFPANNDAPLEFSIIVECDSGKTGEASAQRSALEIAVVVQRTAEHHQSHMVEFSYLVDGTPTHFTVNDDVLECELYRFPLSSIRKALDVLQQSCYIPPFRHVLRGGADPAFDLTVGSALAANWANLRSRSIASGRMATKIQDLLEKIFGFVRFEIQPSPSLDALFVTMNGETLRLGDVGGGLVQMFVIFVNIAEKKPKLILVDEPEIGLHPRLQGDLLTGLVELTGAPVIYTTHSLGLSRLADCQYIISHDGRGAHMRQFEPSKSLSEALGELSYSGYVNMDARKVLLVEGDGDVKTFRMLLRAINIDHEVVVLSLGGSSQIHAKCRDRLQEVRRLSDQVYAIIDSERVEAAGAVDRQRRAFAEVCESLGIRCHILARTATENYFTRRAIDATKYKGYLNALAAFERAPEHWPKRDNWIIAGAMIKEEFIGNDLGQFLLNLKTVIEVN